MSGLSGIGATAGVTDIMTLRQQIIDRSQALQQVHSPEAAPSTQPAGGGFTGALKSALDTVNQTQTHAEAVTGAYETGQVTDIAQVMLARQQSSVAFESTLQVRNKLLSAYQDIMKLGM
jgi:flagellar hook-basal body complex protein FliE